VIALREVTRENVRAVCRLAVAPGQEAFVAPAAVTLAEAQFESNAIVRAAYADDALVGLVAVAYDDPDWWLWRLLIAAARQRLGYGSQVLARVVDLVRERGATELRTSYVPGDGDPSGFYLRFGFEDTGRVEDGERVLRLTLARAGAVTGSFEGS
jgi:diamine N-acetyltransferase